MREPVLVIGAGGMLGRALQASLRSHGLAFRSPSREELDLLKQDTLDAAIGEGDTVINCAAWTDVDGAKAREEEARRLNATAVGKLAELCLRNGAALVHFSTDYVFDGRRAEPYPVEASVSPINAYGRSKAEGEALIETFRRKGLRALVVRTSWLYAPWGKNFVRTIARLSREKPAIKVVNDQRGRPTSAEHLAEATIELMRREASGVFHVTDGGDATWFDLAVRVAAWANPACRVDPCTSEEFPRPAARPRYSVLDVSKTDGIIGPSRPWQEHLARVLPRLEA